MGIIRRYKNRREQQIDNDAEAILRVVSMFPAVEFTGLELAGHVGIDSERLYVALARLESEGRLTSHWADTDRPRRRFYRLAEGRKGSMYKSVWQLDAEFVKALRREVDRTGRQPQVGDTVVTRITENGLIVEIQPAQDDE